MRYLKKKQLKGFTLIECIIAMFILGISSLLLVQAYSQLMRVSAMSSNENISISKQMDAAENKTDSDADQLTTAKKDFKVTKMQIGTGSVTSLTVSDYTFEVDSYQVNGKTVSGVTAPDGSDADTMRYVYFK